MSLNKQISEIIQQELALDIEVIHIDDHTSFREMGMDSLDFMKLLVHLEHHLALNISLESIPFQNRLTIQSLSDIIQSHIDKPAHTL